MIPEVVYPEAYLAELQKEIDEAREKLAAGELPVYDSMEALLEALGLDN